MSLQIVFQLFDVMKPVSVKRILDSLGNNEGSSLCNLQTFGHFFSKDDPKVWGGWLVNKAYDKWWIWLTASEAL